MRTLAVFFVFILACNPPSLDRESQRSIQKELDSRKLVKLSEGEILAAAQNTGRMIADSAQAALTAELLSALQNIGLIEAISYCNLQALSITDSVSKKYRATIKRTSMNVRNPSNSPSGVETELLEAYHYTHSNNHPLSDNVQILGDDEILFTKPIVIGNALCLSCHGSPGNELRQEHHDFIKNLYPNDKATGYTMGDLRGMWIIRLSKKAIIQTF